MRRTPVAMAMDKSTRTIDRDGHLRVLDNVLTGVGVSPYLGAELPDADRLGLDPSRVYNMLRPADELKRAASTLAGKPLLLRHVPVSSADHPTEDVCGCVGSDVAFDGSVVRASLTLWTDEAIDAVQTGSQRDLSCGYWFRPDMSPGTYKGQAFDGVMRSLAFNHLSIVVDGRFPLAMVGDSAARVKRIMAMDEDEDDDAPDVVAQDPHSALCIWLADQLPPDQLDTAHTLIEDMLKWATGDDGWAADSNVYTGQNMMNTTAIVRRIQAIEQAKLAVRPYIGDVQIACDSADAVYIHALAALGHPTAELELHAGSATAVWPALKGKPAGTPGQPARRPAMDAASTKRFNEMFPNAGRLLKGRY